MTYKPPQMVACEESLPGPYVGERWATFVDPQGGRVERKVEAWGQIATPDAHAHMVAYDMWNYLPDRGKGWRYVGWRVQPYGGAGTRGGVDAKDQAELQATLDRLARCR
jgi:hypothetical protein